MSQVTQILSAIDQGDTSSAEELLPLVYQELRNLAARKLSNEAAGQTLQPTALVHEAYLRLVESEQAQQWDSRAHFFAAAAEAMRRILVDRARRKSRPKHGGDLQRVQLPEALAEPTANNQQLLTVHEALCHLEADDPAKAQLVKLRYFAGMSLEEAAAAMNVSRATASRQWTVAKAWLSCKLEDLRD